MAGLRDTVLFTDASLQAYYEMESGALTTDSSTHGITLTNNNTVGEDTGKFGGGASTGASNSNKDLTSTNALGIDGGACSISGWFKVITAPTSSDHFFVGLANANTFTAYWICYYIEGGTLKLLFARERGGSFNAGPIVVGDLGTSVFHHLVVTYDGANVYGYVDNVQSGPTATSGNGISNEITGIHIFEYTNATLNSSVIGDDIAFFNKALTVEEVDILYNSTPTNKGNFFSIL